MFARMSTLRYQYLSLKSKYARNCFLFGSRTIFVCVTRPFKEDYEKLGVKPNATKREIKAAYFEKAKLFHPDSNRGKSGKQSDEFHELNEAYKRLISGETPRVKRRDPRNDPQMREYWQMRERQRQAFKIQYDEDFAKRFGSRDQRVLKTLFWVAVFFWLWMISYPLVKILANHPAGCRCQKCSGILSAHNFNSTCRCERCSLILLQNNPTTAELFSFKK